jgi:hypothetical protein
VLFRGRRWRGRWARNSGAGSRRWRRRVRPGPVVAIVRVYVANTADRRRRDELVAVVAIQIPWAGPAVDDGLEGAKTTFGRCAAPRQVDREHLGLFAGHRGRVTGEQFTGVGGAVFGDPDLLQYVLEIGIRQVDIVFGHAVADLAEISADVGEAGAGAQQVGGQGVAGLMRHVVGSVCYENTFILPGARLTTAMSRNSLAVKENRNGGGPRVQGQDVPVAVVDVDV